MATQPITRKELKARAEASGLEFNVNERGIEASIR